MREQLLSGRGERDEPASSRGRSVMQPLPRLRGGTGERALLVAGCGGFCAVSFLFMSLCVASVSPLEWGLLKNKINGQVAGTPVKGGLHITSPWQGFLTFPATRVTLQWSNSYKADRPQVVTRTGADPHDPDSGGQPISISCAVQFEFLPDKLQSIYLNFGSSAAAKQRYILLAGNMVSNVAQEFIPQDFWRHRHVIAERMLYKVNGILLSQGARAKAFEIMRVDFAPSFEDSITGVQVAEQQKVVNEYNQQVQQVEQQIAVLNSHNDAYIATIHAHAMRTAKEKVGNATKQAFIVKQEAKATNYEKLQGALEFTPFQMAEYIKIRSLMSQSQNGKVVVSLPPPSAKTLR